MLINVTKLLAFSLTSLIYLLILRTFHSLLRMLYDLFFCICGLRLSVE